MRYMILLKSDKAAEAGELPSMELINEMGKFNATMERAGILRAADGLRPSSEGRRVTIGSDDARTVVDGPFAETKELIGGFWIIDVASLDEAVEWARRCPNPRPGGETRLEIRRVSEPEDFGEAFTPEARAAEARMQDRLDNLGR